MRICPTCQSRTDEINCPHEGTPTVVVGGGSEALVGQVIAQRYRVAKLIGEGGFGAVYKALHTGTNDEVAVKVLRTEQAGNAEVVARFQDEAAITASLKQPHTVRVFDFGQTATGDLYIAMEFLEGKTLSKVMDDEQPLGYLRIGHIALQVLKSLAEAHSKGLVHRDLKPDNIFLQTVFGEEDFVKVLDFGIAKSLAQGGQSRTATGVIVGTPPYMSPEQARGTGIDQRTDLYALGCILFEAVTNRVPFHAETAIDTLIQRITNPPPDPRGLCVTPTPEAFCDVVLRAMATQADQRFATAQDMIKALQEALKQPPSPLVVRVDPNADVDERTSAGEFTVIKGGLPAATLTGRAPAMDVPTMASAALSGHQEAATAAISAVRPPDTGPARPPSPSTDRFGAATQARPAPMRPNSSTGPSRQGPPSSASRPAVQPRPASAAMAAAPVPAPPSHENDADDPAPAAPTSPAAAKSKVPAIAGAAVVALVLIAVLFVVLGKSEAPAVASPEAAPAAKAAPVPAPAAPAPPAPAAAPAAPAAAAAPPPPTAEPAPAPAVAPQAAQPEPVKPEPVPSQPAAPEAPAAAAQDAEKPTAPKVKPAGKPKTPGGGAAKPKVLVI